MRRFLAIAVTAAAMLLAGCVSDGNCNGNCTFTTDNGNTAVQSRQANQTGFNSETYVWESFIFSTNRVDNMKK